MKSTIIALTHKELHRVELELINGEHVTRFVYYTCIKYKD